MRESKRERERGRERERERGRIEGNGQKFRRKTEIDGKKNNWSQTNRERKERDGTRSGR